MNELKSFEKNVYSQNGEDGVIQEILLRISKEVVLDHWCVEFGAWDGVYLSNTCRLIREDNYRAVLIEGDPARVKQLHENFALRDVSIICQFVSFDGKNTIDNILSTTSIPEDFDFLSIDVDGVDYHIFESIERFRPKVVCIEFNPTIPNSVDFVQDKSFGVKHGSSAQALVRLARTKGYVAVHATECNLIFVRRDLKNIVINNDVDIEDWNFLGNDPTYLFVGFDGSLLSNKSSINFPWHNLDVPINFFQPLPRYLRVFGGDYGLVRSICFAFWTVSRPGRGSRAIRKRGREMIRDKVRRLLQ
jgi:hypothetical protein